MTHINTIMPGDRSNAFQAYVSNVRDLHLEYKTKSNHLDFHTNLDYRRNKCLCVTGISRDIKKCILGVRLIHDNLDSIEKIMELLHSFLGSIFNEIKPYIRGGGVYKIEILKESERSINSYLYIRLLDFIKCTCDVRIKSELSVIDRCVIELTREYQENYVDNFIKFLDSTHYSEHQKQSS